jgi:cytochrome b involved in lipid metabolism
MIEINKFLFFSLKEIIIFILSILFIIYFFSFYKVHNNNKKDKKEIKTAKQIKENENKNIKYFTEEEVSKHNKRDDCWLIIDGKVYDVTKYIDEHVGGDAILRNAGKDSSKGFHGDQHPEKVKDLLWEFEIGILKKD